MKTIQQDVKFLSDPANQDPAIQDPANQILYKAVEYAKECLDKVKFTTSEITSGEPVLKYKFNNEETTKFIRDSQPTLAEECELRNNDYKRTAGIGIKE